MKIIVVTGIDGSGKSTLLSTLSNSTRHYQVVTLPHINIDQLKGDDEMQRAAQFINQLNNEADIRKVPQLKALALFASMILFKPIVTMLKAAGHQIIFCERHPLIDTSIYAGFYAEKLYPGSIDQMVLDEIEIKYAAELSYLVQCIPNFVINDNLGICNAFIAFIYQWFYLDKKTSIENLKEIFKVDLPDQLYYLEASPEFLFNRIKDRKVLEAHESLAVFEKLEGAYKQLFHVLNERNKDLVQVVSSENKQCMVELQEKLLREDFLNG